MKNKTKFNFDQWEFILMVAPSIIALAIIIYIFSGVVSRNDQIRQTQQQHIQDSISANRIEHQE